MFTFFIYLFLFTFADTTTKDLPNYLSQEQPSFLAYKAGDAPVTGQVKPKEKRRENSNNAQVPTTTSTQLPLARTASAAPIKQEAVGIINVSQPADIKITQPLIFQENKNKLKQDQNFCENDFTKKNSSSNSLLKYLARKPIYGTVNLKKEIKTELPSIKTEQPQHT